MDKQFCVFAMNEGSYQAFVLKLHESIKNIMFHVLKKSRRVNTQKVRRPKCPSEDQWIAKMRHIHIMEYYSAMKMNEVLIHATTWMDLEDISLSETCQTHKNTNTVMNPLKYLKQANSWRQKVQ